MPAKAIQCRWGILGCGAEAARFVADLQASGTSDLASTSSSPDVQHTIVAISSASFNDSRAFADAHLHAGDRSRTAEAFGTSTELHAHPAIDAIFIAGPQSARYQEAISALRGGKAVLMHKPLAITSSEARELCELATREKGRWLGIVMRKRDSQEGLLWAGDECAKGLAELKAESDRLPWSEALAVLEALDEIRASGTIQLSPQQQFTPSFPKLDSPQDVRMSLDGGPRRPESRASEASDATFHSGLAHNDENLVGSTANSSATALRSQIHELKHILRQKTAIIVSLEQKAGIPSGSSERARKATRGRNSLPATSAASYSPSLGGRARTASMDRMVGSQGSSNEQNAPFSDVANTADLVGTPGSTGGAAARRRRKDANTSLTNGYGTPDRVQSPLNGTSGNQLGLETVPESGRRGTLPLGEGFLSPTIASENRRLATTAALGSPVMSAAGVVQGGTPSSTAGKGSSKVIESLTNELNAARAALDETKTQLRTSQRTVTTVQRSLDEVREALGRSRAENEASGQMLARKDRQHQEVLERARKAEAEAKELGKSSREWGARVRKVEAELGEERILKQRAEVQYDAITASWKQIREAWEKEMMELRMTHGEQAKKNRETLQEIEAKYKQIDEEGKAVHRAVADLEQERRKAAEFVVQPVKDLVGQLKEHEAHTSSHDAAVQGVQDELKRILHLMRTHAD